ncbi:Two-component sensor histidine kinase, contains HisKA and HATPase domains [Fodinibius salinus]|uniref:histidine kinase n=1 Tax=Fodinibius salinus TaxID=860790 RepID=A0A5D3YLT4_9BACT|nr:histidine kinase dimerization/phosphoacceptor domain -containing protein [Fodinibius salinus]TYP93657.1 Two-component sensor histidine kinase, contains HisKA and HATPase domains [Fodinibius salinus]
MKDMNFSEFQELLNDSSRLLVYRGTIKDELTFNYFSENTANVLGFSESVFIKDAKAWFDCIHVDDTSRVKDHYHNLAPGESAELIFRFQHQRGHFVWLRSHIKHIGENTIIGTATEITEEKEAEEKETLLSEIHHRVKNNLAIMSGLLEMQALNTKEEKLLQRLNENQSRIQAMGRVHEKMYESNLFSEVPISEYIDDLLEKIDEGKYADGSKVTVTTDMEQLSLNISQAVPFGIIVNELVENCYRYAFEGQKSGKINLSLSRDEDTVTLVIKDNGIGLPDEFESKSKSSTGMTLIDALVGQLSGTFEPSSSSEGTTFVVTFDVDEKESLG